ncbi:MAG: choice-of-anchor Q domain-containing protein [Dokdonella sp.]
MPLEHVHALRRLLLVSCVSLALAGPACAAPVVALGRSTHVGGRLDGVAASKSLTIPGPTPLHPSQVTSVSNCDDSGPGSLRDAITAAGEGDTIDLTQLACSTITLTTGNIMISQDTLSLVGPGPSLVINQDATITVGRILSHIGYGTLTLSGLSVMYGYFNYNGGCLYSKGNLTLDNASLSRCQSGMNFVGKYDHDNRGGAAYVKGNLTMSRSTVTSSVCYSQANGLGFGGGLFVGGSADIRESTITDNYAGFFGYPGNVGGITITGTEPSIIVNSTISGNVALNLLGGIYAYAGLTLLNSTIAFNVAVNGLTARVPGGLQAYNGPLTMNSTIISNNNASGSNYDLYAFGVVSGTNNLVMSSSNSPPGTLTADPDLQALADNGGPTKTRALLATSVAIDAGNNVSGVSTDERGAGFARVGGAQADIGAFEFQIAAPATYTIGGNIAGLAGSGLVLQQSGSDNVSITTSGSFIFPTAVSDGSVYNVTVLAQPTSPNQTCGVTNGQGVVSGANITDVAVTCTTATYTVGGTVNGLVGSGLVLQQNGGDDMTIATNGSFTFPTSLADGSTFTVSASAQPSNPAQICVVANGNGTLAGADITDVAVMCSTDITDLIFADGFE